MSGFTSTTSCTIESLKEKDAELSPDSVIVSKKILPLSAREGHRVTITITLEDVHTRLEWSKAYAQQGRSDLEVYERLVEWSKEQTKPQISSCHRLHYLQMASEKIAKAYRLRDPHDSLSTLLTSHVATTEFIRKYLSSPDMKRRYEGKNEQLGEFLKEMKHAASEIEKLAPAVDREKAPHNVEYPWSDGARISIPCQSRFPIEDLPPTSLPKFVNILKEVSDAILTR